MTLGLNALNDQAYLESLFAEGRVLLAITPGQTRLRNRVRWGGIDCAIEVAAGGCLPPVDCVQAGDSDAGGCWGHRYDIGSPSDRDQRVIRGPVAHPATDKSDIRRSGTRYGRHLPSKGALASKATPRTRCSGRHRRTG